MSRRRIVAIVIVTVVGLAVAGGAVAFTPIARVATGYSAVIACAAHLVSDRPLDDALADLPDNPLVPLLVTRTGDDEVSTSLLGTWRSTAYHHPDHGCTLARGRPELPALSTVPTGDPDVAWPAGEGAATPSAALDAEAVTAALDAAFVEDRADGIARGTRAIAVVHDGQLVAERYGEGFGPDTPLLGWSMGKSIASTVIGRLVHEGRLDIDDTDLRPEWADDDRAQITVEHLLTMTSGLAFDEVYDPGTDATTMLFTPGDVAAFAADKELVAPPGEVFSYSSGTTNVLCDVAARAAGDRSGFVHDLVLAPLGMSSAVIEPDASGLPVCSSFAYASARDWARFGQWHLDDGVWDGERLLPEGWVAAATTPVAAATESGYGYQWWLNARPDGTLRMPDVPADAYWASGNEGQQVVVVPSADLVVVRLGLTSLEGVTWGLEPFVASLVDAIR